MRKERRMGSFAAISIRISAAVFAIWLLCMAVITLITAQFVCDGVQDAANDYVNFADTFSLEKVVAMRDELVDHAVERQMMNELQYGAFYHPQLPGPDLLRSTLRGSQIKTARAFYTAEGELLLHSGSYFHFYYTEEQHHWDGNDDGWAYVDVDKLFANDGAFVDRDWFDKWFFHAIAADSRVGLKMTGYFDGTEFIPSKLEYDANINNGPIISGRHWITVYEAGETDPADGTVYANYAEKQV